MTKDIPRRISARAQNNILPFDHSQMNSDKDISAMTGLAVRVFIDKQDKLWLLMPSGLWVTIWRQHWFYLQDDVWREYAPLPPVPPAVGYTPGSSA